MTKNKFKERLESMIVVMNGEEDYWSRFVESWTIKTFIENVYNKKKSHEENEKWLSQKCKDQ